MRVFHIINSMGTGGAEARLASTLSWPDSDGLELSLACLRASGAFIDGIPAHVKIYDLAAATANDLSSATDRFSRILKEERPTIVHTHLVHAGLVGRCAARREGVPALVSTQHNAWHPKDDSPLYRTERKSWNLSDGFVAISCATASYLRTGGYKGPIATCPTGVAVPWLVAPPVVKLPQDKPFVLAVGHMRDPQKGHDILIRAFELVVREEPSQNLLIAGEGPLEGELRQLVCSLGIEGRVHFLGHRSDTMALMARSSVFVLASRWEGFGRVLIEAMAAGAPIVATNVEAIPQVITNGETGLVVQPEAPPALASAILRILKEPFFSRRIRRAAQRTARQKFDLNGMIRAERSFYRELLAKKGANFG